MPDLKHKVVKLPSGETIAFPATMPDAQVAGLITAFRQGKFSSPQSGQTHAGNLHTQVSPKTTDNSEHLRQSGDTTPQLPAPSWNELRQYVNDKTQPTVLPPLQGKLNYSQSAQDINARDSLGALKGEVLQNSPHKVEAPDGKTYVFPDLDSLNHFRNEAGIEK